MKIYFIKLRIAIFAATIVASWDNALAEPPVGLIDGVVRIEVSGVGPQGVAGVTVGSGFVISSNGYVLTSDHVLQFQRSSEFTSMDIEVLVKANSGIQTVTATIIDRNPRLRIALLKLPEINRIYRPLALCRNAPAISQIRLHGYGYPNGGEIVSRRDGHLDGPDATDGRWQTAVDASPGMSGGPVTDQSGRVVGIIESGAATAGTNVTITPIQWAISYAMIADARLKDCSLN